MGLIVKNMGVCSKYPKLTSASPHLNLSSEFSLIICSFVFLFATVVPSNCVLFECSTITIYFGKSSDTSHNLHPWPRIPTSLRVSYLIYDGPQSNDKENKLLNNSCYSDCRTSCFHKHGVEFYC